LTAETSERDGSENRPGTVLDRTTVDDVDGAENRSTEARRMEPLQTRMQRRFGGMGAVGACREG
jgi:hypothetical protein